MSDHQNIIKQVVDMAVVKIMRCYIYKAPSIEKTIDYIARNSLLNSKEFDLTTDNV